MPEITAGPGHSVTAFTKSRWMVLTQEPVDGYHLLLWLDGISDESLSNKADVPVHPIDRGRSVADHSVRGARAYIVRGYLATPLSGDNVLPKRNNAAFQALYGSAPVVIQPPVAGLPRTVGQAVVNDRGLRLVTSLDRILGIPVDIFSPKYGKLLDFVLVSYDDTRDGTTRINETLSFQEIRRPSTERVVIPKIPRARAQNRPQKKTETTPDRSTGDNTSSGSNWYHESVRDGGRVDPTNPNSPLRSERLAGLVEDVPQNFFSGVFRGVTGVP